ncbi:MAG: dTDP-4-dehydrorhamnose reductase [Candidatus Doudnabacteria bacterium]|nr:dTDP-4-dehydrorhamnose reductase [Candidatus Doudnabacteria bacterium]
MSNILILGSQGMLGGELKRTFSKALGWDRKELDLGQIGDLEQRLAALPQLPDAVINCAAYNDVDGAEAYPDKAFLINSTAVGKIASACNSLGIPLIHFSSNYVFDGEKGEYREDDQPNALSTYGKSKYQGEQLLRKNCFKYYLIRTSVLFGQEAESQFAKKSFIEIMLELRETTDTIKAVTDEINSLTYVSDLASSVEALITKKYPYGIYHIVNGGQASWYDFAQEIFRLKGKEVKLEAVDSSAFPRKASRPKKAVLLNTKFPELRSWQEALAEFLS